MNTSPLQYLLVTTCFAPSNGIAKQLKFDDESAIEKQVGWVRIRTSTAQRVHEYWLKRDLFMCLLNLSLLDELKADAWVVSDKESTSKLWDDGLIRCPPLLGQRIFNWRRIPPLPPVEERISSTLIG